MGMGIDGLTSGLKTSEIINALMNAEAIPQSLMKKTVANDTYLLTALQALNTKFASLFKQASELSKPDGLAMYQANSSSPAITVTAAAGARPIALDLNVTQLAQAHAVVTAPQAAWPTSPAVLTFVKTDGTTTTKVEVNADSDSLDAIAYAVNKSDAGVSAVKVASGTDASGATLYRLQFTAKETGAAGAFKVYQGSAADVDAGALPLTAVPGAAVLRTGQDAKVTLWAGTPAEQTITSKSNTFTAISPGIDITVNQVTTAPAVVTVLRDDKAVTAAAKDLTSNVNIILGSIFTQSAVSAAGAAAGNVTSGLFTSNSTTAAAKDKLFTAVVSPVNGKSLSTIGINSTKNGDLVFDEAVFAAAYAKDPALVESTLQTVTARVADAAKAISDPYSGTLSQSIKGKETVINDLNAQILKWDDRLAQRRGALQSIYTNLEVQLGKMQSQQNWLTSQIGSLDSGSSKK
ncbi:flagellar filament capping protein FliD [Arthrobacter sp. GMC3]|uniref:flagellar filament capping protein FliD n=1 Tax=Arthrobacter sp. GMC3 TaxID=2058894 RepID=UPI000CE42792|nr:flagellar filament capping protein FliD [Arthrobacter sp. GMC3]